MARMDVSRLSLEQLMAYYELSKKQNDGLFDDWNELVNSKVIRQYTDSYVKEHSKPLLQEAIDTENMELAEALVLELHQNVNATGKSGYPLLFHALKDVKWLNILAKGDLDVNKKDLEGTSALEAAYKNRNEEVFDRLIELGIDVEYSLFLASLHNWDKKWVYKLINAGANVIEKYCSNIRPLMLTTSLDIAKVLVESGADINAIMFNGTSVLMHHMKQYGNLLEIRTPIAIEEAQRIREIIIFLLENGVNLIPRDGKSALKIAKEVEDEELVELIKMYMKK